VSKSDLAGDNSAATNSKFSTFFLAKFKIGQPVPTYLMLSKLFNSARNILNPIPQTNNTSEEQSSEEITKEMVTTRGQRGKHAPEKEISGEDAVVPDVSRSSRKRQRQNKDEIDLRSADEEVISTPAKKQKVLPLREKDDDGPNKHTRVVVEIPVSKIPVELQNVKEDISQSAEAESLMEEDGEESEMVPLEISDLESEDGSEASEARTKPSPTLPNTKKQNKSMASPSVSETTPMSNQPKHKRFGSEEPGPEPEFFSTAAEIIESDEESSDDDAPEVVGMQDALKRAKSKARDAAKAVEE
jgi:U3 small nucleolar RNA-associated protein 16